MSQSRTYNRSFAGGIISEELHGRFDLSKLQTGVKNARNMLVRPGGALFAREGFDYIQTAKHGDRQCRLFEFNYNTEQTYILEFGHQYIRFHTGGSTLLAGAAQAITGVTNATTGVLSYAGADPANGTWMYLSGNTGMTEINARYVVVTNVNAGANTFELYDLFGNPIDTSDYGVWTAGGTMDAVYEISSPYLESELFELDVVQSADVVTITHTSREPRELSRLSATSWSLATISFAPTIGTPVGQTATPAVAGAATWVYAVTAIASDGLEESLQSANATTAAAATPLSATNYVTVACTAVSGAIRYNFYRKDDGIYGFIGQSGTNSFRDTGITPDLSITPPNSNNPFSSSGNYPAAVSYSDQRRVFAGTTNRRQTVWMTRAGTESNLSYSIPTRDDDSITFRIAAREANAIRHLVPLGDLLALTASAVWRIWGGSTDVITPATLTAKPQAYVGANAAQPLTTPVSVLYAQAEGSMIQELVYSTSKDGTNSGYQVNDLSVFAPDLFEGYTVTDMAYAHSPYKCAFFIRDDGVMLGLTYVKEQEVAAWHQHDTDGEFESVAVTTESAANRVYVAVKRTINGQTVRYIERLHIASSAAIEDCFFVDSGLTYDSTPVDTLRGFYHLEGETIKVLVDGGGHPDVVVTDGVINLDYEGSTIHGGLGYTQDLHLLPAALQGEAFGHGRPKNVNRAFVRVVRSWGFFAGPDEDNLIEAPWRTDEDYGTPAALQSGIVDLTLLPDWSDDATILFRQVEPLPMRIASIGLEIEVGG